MTSSAAPTGSTRVELTFPIPGAHAPGGLEGSTVTAWVNVPPDSVAVQPIVIVCWSGYAYDKSYWDVHIPGHPDLSFAQGMAEHGIVVVAADPVGVADSAGPDDGDLCTLAALTSANAHVVAQIRERVRIGSLAPGLAPIDEPLVVGLGHSMGAILAVIEQARFGSYDALCLLGLVHTEVVSMFTDSLTDDVSADDLRAQAFDHVRPLFGEGLEPGATYVAPDKAPIQEFVLNGPDAPAEIIAYDNARPVRWPIMPVVEMYYPDMIEGHAQQVTTPVFLAVGEHELMSPGSCHRQAASYAASDDVTVFVQPDAYHCTNFQPNRDRLWNRIAGWTSAQADRRRT